MSFDAPTTLRGTIGRDPEVQHFESGSFKVRTSLACYEGKNKDGSRKDSSWFELEAWGDLDSGELSPAILLGKCSKKQKIAISGHLKIDTWNDRNTGDPRSKPVVVVATVGEYTIRGRSGSNSTAHSGTDSPNWGEDAF